MSFFALNNYLFNPYAIPPFVASLVILGLMMFFLKMERGSLVSISLLAMAATFFMLFFTDAMIFSSNNEVTAMVWLKTGYIGICLLPAACQQCTYAILGITQHHQKTITLAWIISFFFLILSQTSSEFISGVHMYWWGYYGTYGWLGVIFTFFTFSTFALGAFHFIKEYHNATLFSLQQARAKACMIAFGLGYAGSVDFIAKFGYGFYPFGFIPILTLLFVLARAALRYRLTITPSFAAKNIIETMGDALVILGEDGTVALTNHEAVKLLGREKNELLYQPFFKLTQWDLFQKTVPDIASLCPIRDMPVSLLNKSGHKIHLLLSVSVMEDKKRIQAIVCLFRDVTQKKLAAEQLRQSHDTLEKRVGERTRELEEANRELNREAAERNRIEQERADLIVKSFIQSKLASLGEIATGIAHEINQPLSFIKIMFEATLRDIRKESLEIRELSDDCRESLKQISRITSIINHLRTFGRSDDSTMDQVNLCDVLDNTMILMGERLRLSNIEPSIDVPLKLPNIMASSVRLEQVFINLLQNAMDALKTVNKPMIRISISETAESIMIIVSDNGEGIPSAIQEKIFDPFFTSKEVGKGTGLGLAVSYGIIKEHKGTIVLDTSTKGWTSFVITLPNIHD